ncbi:MAG TPA: sigma-70 family RNA polymerase sigma factor [Thermoanaerobaculia bacterium]|nr:sigma-70 family RNA polymerase sigma factor [Thermoanaerobaculia bacterium]
MAPEPDDDALAERLLVLRAQLGSQDAYAGLFRRYDARLLFYLRRLVGSRADAEDVRQEVWMTVVRKLATLEEPAAFRTWLYRIARHRGISWLRQRRPEVSLDEAAPHDEPVVERESDEEAGFGPEEAAAVRAALDTLPPGQREILSLRFLGGLSYAEIAGVLDRPVGTVRSRLHTAKAALRAALANPARHAATRS